MDTTAHSWKPTTLKIEEMACSKVLLLSGSFLLFALLIGSSVARPGRTRLCDNQMCPADEVCVVSGEGKDAEPFCLPATEVDDEDELEVRASLTKCQYLRVWFSNIATPVYTRYALPSLHAPFMQVYPNLFSPQRTVRRWTVTLLTLRRCVWWLAGAGKPELPACHKKNSISQ